MAIKKDKELFIVGEDITPRQRAYLSKKGDIKQLTKGVYIRSDLDESEMSEKYALRIASYVYKSAYFSHVSALSAKLVKDTLFMKGSYIIVNELFGVNIAHYKNLFEHPEIKEVTVSDAKGEFSIKVSDELQLILEGVIPYDNFPHSALSDDEIKRLLMILSDRYGSPDAAMSAVYNFADKNNVIDLYEKLIAKVDFYVNDEIIEERSLEALQSFDLLWHGKKFAKLDYVGDGWNFDYDSQWLLPMSLANNRYKQLPSFVEALLPEVAIGNKSDDKNAIDLLKSGKRYLSNMVMLDSKEDNSDFEYIEDMIEGSVEKFSNEHNVFVGNHNGIPELDRRFMIKLGRMLGTREVPRISGAQVKMPAHLSYDGVLKPVLDNESFTHILKLPGTTEYVHLGLLEWLSLSGLEYAGVNTAKTALVNIEELGHKPAVISERFDIRQSVDDGRMIFCEDMSSVMNVISGDKYSKSAEEIGRAIVKHSTSPSEDSLNYIEQVVASWLIGNGDFHLKNIVLVKEKSADSKEWESVRLSPAFDVICTSVVHAMDHKTRFGIEGETYGININGKKIGIELDDFVSMGRMIGVKRSDTVAIVERLAKRLYDYTYHMDDMLPAFVRADDNMIKNIEEMKDHVRYRIETVGVSPSIYKTEKQDKVISIVPVRENRKFRI